ncbi:methyltransferase [Brevibacterium sp. p3-SID960]|uniref:class I SAM-dependent RNA methyltransferase n=1 Tax=Brevibacterium sp. p3-SID960 TaxID=2916063 RepID=UPI0021A8453B|nr:TRAM domain-containing protein [Brevibacterium sp. p3-SID960]MCT1689667.1 methyltransferase [Brevibacterium sp. p3-SID960]
MSPAAEAVAGDAVELTVDKQVGEGYGLARHEGRVVFVSGAIPGERVRAELTQVKKRLAYARTTDVLQPSPHRVADRRLSWGAAGIGGIEFAHVELPHSRELKAEAAAEQLSRLGGIEGTGLRIAAAPSEHAAEAADPGAAATTAGTAWRTRVQLAVDADGAPGMRAAGSHVVIPVDTVPLAVPVLDDLGLHTLGLPGLERIELTASHASGAVVLHTRPGAELDPHAVESVAVRLGEQDGQWSLLHRSSQPVRRGGRGTGPEVRNRGGSAVRNRGGSSRLEVLVGTGEVTERLHLDTPGGPLDRDFRLRADGFWQVHVDAAAVLAGAVVEAATGAKRVLDLYCGAGLLACAVGAAHEVPVTGLEGAGEAIAAARANGADLDAEFAIARIDRLSELPAADVIILDPPRAGAGPAVTDALTASDAERIIYVSCDAGTFARDARALADGGFTLASCRGLDLFPLTAHAEFVSVFTR